MRTRGDQSEQVERASAWMHGRALYGLTPHALRIVIFCFMLAGVMGLACYGWISGNHNILLPVTGGASLLVLMIPVVIQERYDFFQPLSFVLLTTLVGVTLRSIYLVARDSPDHVGRLLLGKMPADLIDGGALIVVGSLFLAMGYMVATPAPDVSRLPILRTPQWNRRRLFIVILILLGIGLTATVVFLRKTGLVLLALDTLSTKRQFVVEDASYRFASLGYYRWAASLAEPAFYLYFTWFASENRKWKSVCGAAVVVLALLAMAFFILTSRRGATVNIVIVSLLIWHYTGRGLKWRTLLQGLLIVLVMIGVMTALRLRQDDVASITEYIKPIELTDAVIGSRNFFGIDKTDHIIDSIPDKLDYEYGSTFVRWMVAWVPRTVWPGKPVISVGQTLGEEVFRSGIDRPGGGVPPGFLVELYWNFGIFGIPPGMFGLGAFLRWLYRVFLPHIRTNKNALMLYVSLLVPFSFGLLGSDLSRIIIHTFMSVFTLSVVLAFISKRTLHSSNESVPRPIDRSRS